MSNNPTVVVAMSGGVDSSVAAALLVEQGYQVIGMMLRLWSEPGTEDDNRCCTPDAMAMARRVAAKLDIPFYAIDVQERFHEVIVQHFIDGYTQGITPNPCVLCNRHIRWGFLLDRARAFGAEYMATGHYAQVVPSGDAPEASGPARLGRVRLLRGRDQAKDQSYVLSVLGQEQLRQTLLPLGGLTKPEVREQAARFGLPVASRADSQDLCFLARRDYRGFLARNAPHPPQPGPIINTSGEVIGEHQGLAFYTIGQRKGLSIPAAAPHAEALYVIRKDIHTNTLVIGNETELGQRELRAAGINWVSGMPPQEPFRAAAKIRYKANEAWATITPEGSQAQVVFDQPLRDITPGQRVVFYQGEECLGGGTIEN
jgi:tRNA-specific 2-thiouridylase